MATIPEMLSTAVQHHRAGQLQSAESLYRQILQLDPQHVDALHLLGTIASHVGNFPAAIELMERAALLAPGVAEIHNNLAKACFACQRFPEAITAWQRASNLKPDDFEIHNLLGKVLGEVRESDQAIASFRKAVALKPDFAEAHYNLANTLKTIGQLDDAIASYRCVVALMPNSAQAHGNLGIALMDRELVNDAIACYRQAIALNPELRGIYGNLGNALRAQGKLNEAVPVYKRAVEIGPKDAEAWCNLGTVYRDQEKLHDAITCYRRAIELKPKFVEGLSNLGIALKELGQMDEAIACYRQALDLDPGFVEVYGNLGNALTEHGMPDQGIACYRQGLGVKPDYAVTHANLGSALKDLRKLDEAIACFHTALTLNPSYAVARSNLLLTSQYHSDVTLEKLAAAHAEYDQSLALRPGETAWPYAGDREPGCPLRIGFVSPDLCRHPVGYFLIRCLEHLDRSRFETFFYSDRLNKDEMTARFQAVASTWRDVNGSSNNELFDRISSDQIDILFDLAGHTAKNRLQVFARKPSPIQVTWAGYVGTTGLKAIDYILADQYEIPRESETHYCEKVLRMPDGYVTYDPPKYAPDVSPLPAPDRGYVTFGCFNNQAKITPRSVALWAQILIRIPDSKLVLKYKGMNDASISKALSEEFVVHGIDPDRIEFRGWSDHAELLAEYHRIDVALDPLPYNGGLTTCEAMWMGVPVITTPGETFAARHSLSHLSNVGLKETIARDMDEYVELAVALAADWPRLSAIRSTLRQQMASSPLCDGKRFASDFARILFEISETRN